MRKAFSIIFAVVLSLASLVLISGCSASVATYQGHWVCTSVDNGNDQSASSVDLASQGLSGDDFLTIDLTGDETAIISFYGEDLSQGQIIKWKPTSDGVVLQGNSDYTMELKYDSDTRTMSADFNGTNVVL